MRLIGRKDHTDVWLEEWINRGGGRLLENGTTDSRSLLVGR